MSQGNKGGWRGRIGGVIFGGIFAAVGIGFLFFSIIPTLYEGWQMQGWQPVQAEVLDTQLKSHRGDKSTTYSVSARYRYDWRGREYVGDRVGIGSGSDNVGDWHQQHYYRLKSARENNRRVTVWVDPAAPQNAVIDRDIRWGLFAFEMLFVVLFGGAGVGIMVYVWRRRVSNPDSPTPWLDNPAWRDNRIRSGGKALLWFLWIFGIAWMAFMIPLWMNAEQLAREGMPLSLFPYLFPLIGLAVLAQALIKTLRWRRFGNAVLSLNPFPGVPGGKVGGMVELPMDRREPLTAEVSLSCIHVYWRRRGSKNERQQEIIWQDSQKVRLRPDGRGGLLAFSFNPPRDLPSSSEGSDHHKWELALKAKLAGPDLDHRFVIPVYADSAMVHDAAKVEEPSVAYERPPERSHTIQSLPDWLGIDYRHGGFELKLPMFRNLTLSLIVTVMGLIFGGVGVFLFEQSDVPFFFALIFTLVGVLALLGGLYALGNSQWIHISPRGVAKVIRVFGVPFSRKVPVTEISGLDKRIAAQSGNRAFYSVFVRTRQGKRINLADSLPSASAADYLIEQFNAQLRLKPGEAVAEATAEESPAAAMEMAQKARKIQRWVKLIGFVIFALVFGEFAIRFLNL